MGTDGNRRLYESRGLRYPSDLSDAEWALIEPPVPPAKGFEPPPKRGVVERAIAWIDHRRRLAKDHENLNRTALAVIRLAGTRLMLRRFTRYCYPK